VIRGPCGSAGYSPLDCDKHAAMSVAFYKQIVAEVIDRQNLHGIPWDRHQSRLIGSTCKVAIRGLYCPLKGVVFQHEWSRSIPIWESRDAALRISGLQSLNVLTYLNSVVAEYTVSQLNKEDLVISSTAHVRVRLYGGVPRKVTSII
jgi:hypothetical protein